MSMNSRKLYAGAVGGLLAAVLLIAGNADPSRVRTQQHLEYNTEVADHNLSIDAKDFSSRLPVVDINTDGKTIPGTPPKGQLVSKVLNSYITAHIQIREREGTLHTLSQEPDIDSDVQIRIRGNSSRRFDKKGYLLHFIGEDGQKKGYPVMGMEKDSTWVLNGPYLDKTLMRNYMWYNLSGQIMEWAPDVRFCEVFLNGEYQGVYIMMEQISVGEGRVEVSKYDGKAGASSYIVCADRESVNVVDYLDNFTYYSGISKSRIEIKYPNDKKMNPKIKDYISRDFSKFERALYSYDYDSRRYGFRNDIDVDSFVDYVIINEVTQNSDAGVFSTYVYKDVGGKLKTAVWDFNNCCDNYIDVQTPVDGFFIQERIWFTMLMKDEGFTDQIIDRYKELRRGVLSDEYIKKYIEEVSIYLGPAIDRNFQVWGYTFQPEEDLLTETGRSIGSYDAAVEQYEERLLSRLAWMDQHIEGIRSYSHESKNKKFNH